MSIEILTPKEVVRLRLIDVFGTFASLRLDAFIVVQPGACRVVAVSDAESAPVRSGGVRCRTFAKNSWYIRELYGLTRVVVKVLCLDVESWAQ